MDSILSIALRAILTRGLVARTPAVAGTIGMLVSLAAQATPAASSETPEQVAQRIGCLQCHAVERDRIGIAYNKVAERYKANPRAAEQLSARIRAGDDHPKIKVSEADVAVILKWVLSRPATP